MSNGSCLDCFALKKSEADKKHYLRHADKIKANVKKWRSENIEKVRENDRKKHLRNRDANIERSRLRYAKHRDEDVARKRNLYRENPEFYRQKNRIRYKENPDPWRINARNRKARKRNAEGFHTAEEIRTLFSRQRSKCANCAISIKAGYHADHIKPLSRGGSNWIRNIQLLCAPCNLRKRAHDPVDFARMEGRLI